jgi:molybdopterin converting factor small subunit
MRELAGGVSRVSVPGGTLAEVINALDERHPGLKDRLTEGGKLRRGLAAFVNDQSPNAGLQTKVAPDDDIYFAPQIAGGSA